MKTTRFRRGQHDLEDGDMADDFIQLPGQKRAGQDQGKVLCPNLFQHQACAFDDVQRSVEKNGEADLF